MRRAPCHAQRARHRVRATPGRRRHRLAFACISHLCSFLARATSLARRLTTNALSSKNHHLCTLCTGCTRPGRACRCMGRRSSNPIPLLASPITHGTTSRHISLHTGKHLWPNTAHCTTLHCTHHSFWPRPAPAHRPTTIAHGFTTGTPFRPARGSAHLAPLFASPCQQSSWHIWHSCPGSRAPQGSSDRPRSSGCGRTNRNTKSIQNLTTRRPSRPTKSNIQ